MEVAVLVKVVPPLEGLRYDAERRSVVRDGTDLYLNPFDQRALRVALDVRRPGERITVVSLGPRAVRDALRDTRALGVDRTILVSDLRCAGSDTLATARTLATVLARIGPDLVLGGAWTTDSETGQVGPEVAALLGLRLLTGARALVRSDTSAELTVTVDTPTGWATYRAPLPLLVTVGEKIAKPAKVAPEDRARIAGSEVEVLGLDDLAIPPERAGLAGSPTAVHWVREDAPHRSPVIFADGPPRARVAAAAAALASRLRAKATPSMVRHPWPEPAPDDREVLVLVTDAAGGPDPSAPPLLSEVRRSMPGYWPSAVWLGRAPPALDSARLARAGAASGVYVPLPQLPTDSRSAATAFGAALDHRPRAAAGLFLSDAFGREVAGQVAASRSLGLTGDAVGVELETGDRIVWSKPSFGGRTIAGIVSRTRPSLATVRPGAWEEETGGGRSTGIVWSTLPPAPASVRLLPFESGTEVGVGARGLEESEVVVAVGMGVGGPAGVAALTPLLDRWRAALGATRRVVDAGWVPRQFQIGLTGRAPAPRLGVLLGVGGSPNHLVAWRRAHTVLAVNRDPDAPVFRDVDVGIVGTLEEIVPLLGEALAPLLDV